MNICPHRNKHGISALRRIAIPGTFVTGMICIAHRAMS
jgi:hypothetical protein